jgi:hypothetical protein
MRWLLRLVLFRVLGSRVMLALAVLAWIRSVLQRGRVAAGRRNVVGAASARGASGSRRERAAISSSRITEP